VDDGSTDCSREVIEMYRDRVITVLKSNGGQASAINAGFARSRGDVIMFLDSDDVLRPDIGASIVDEFVDRPDLGKVEFRMQVIDGAGQPTGAMKPADHLPRPQGDLRQMELQAPFEVLWMSTSANAFSRRVLEQVMPIPEAAYPVCGADWYLAHVSPFFGPVLFLEKIGASYRVHGANQYVSDSLNLTQIRQSIAFMGVTSGYIQTAAQRTGLISGPPRPDQILSFSQIANRMISLALDPARHPVASDNRATLLRLGIVALQRRQDVSPLVKTALFLWLCMVAVAPRPLARNLAEQLVVLERRPAVINAALAAVHRRHRRNPTMSHFDSGRRQP
jgi:glycosyl transferase family 2